jgi:thiamine-monophosphate kinase
LSEFARLALLRKLLGTTTPPGVVVGIGDDAAVLTQGAGSLVWTVDSSVEGVHFRREWASLHDIGWRSFMAAASDLAAMGATPRGALSALVLPETFTDAKLEELARGQSEAAAALGTSVIGGNLSRGTELSITTSLLGEAARPVLRMGAKSGDTVAVAGRVGLAAAGLEALGRGLSSQGVARAIEAWRRPRALIAEGAAGSAKATAGIDLSDGLVLDASRLATESGISIVLDANRVLSAAGPDVTEAAKALSLESLDLALYGGEDYALLMTFAPGEVAPPFIAIGECQAGDGVFLQAPSGQREKLEPRGFDHFSRAT